MKYTTKNEIHDYKIHKNKKGDFLVSFFIVILGTFFKSAKPPLAVSRSLRVRFY